MTAKPNLAPFRRALETFRAPYARALASGKVSGIEAIHDALTVRALEGQLRDRPESLGTYVALAKPGQNPGQVWVDHWSDFYFDRLMPNAARDSKVRDYQQVAQSWTAASLRAHSLRDAEHKVEYLVEENATTKLVVRLLVDALRRWVIVHQFDSDFTGLPTDIGVLSMLEERGDLVTALRVAQTLPMDTESFQSAQGRTGPQELFELGVGMWPVAGTLLALGESVTGRDLFGNRLGTVERAALAALCLLPITLRLFRAGRAFYSTERLVRLYGSDVRLWQRATKVAETYARNTQALRVLADGEQAVVRDAAKLEQVAPTIVEALTAKSAAATAALYDGVAPTAARAFEALSGAHPVIAQLDAQAVERMMVTASRTLSGGAAGNRVIAAATHVKGAMFEDLIEARIRSFLSQPTGVLALGLRSAEPILYIPGRMVTDTARRALTDGLLCVRRGNILKILAILEAKSGPSVVRDLARGSSDATAADLAELSHLMLDEAAEQAIDETRWERVTHAGLGGQVADDIERLDQVEHPTKDQPDLARILVGSGDTRQEFQVEIDRSVRVFGFVPDDVSAARVTQQLRDLGYNFDALRVGATDGELNAATGAIVGRMLPPQ